MMASSSFDSVLVSTLEFRLLLRVILILMMLPALFVLVSLTGDMAKVDKHLG